MKRVTIVNRHYPPNQGITGESAWELATFLLARGLEVHIVHIARSYLGGGASREPVGTTHSISTLYEGQNKWLRFIAGPLDGLLLLLKARKIRSDVTIVMTSPPLLPFWAALLLGTKFRWFFWAMDLFPEGFVADRKIKDTNLIYRWIIKKTYQHRPDLLIALGQEQAKHIQKKFHGEVKTIVLPCGVLIQQHQEDIRPNWRQNDNLVYLGYAGNVGEAHSADFLKFIIKHLDTSRFKLVLAIYGTKASDILEIAQHKEGVSVINGGIPRSELHWLDVQLVSLLPVWTHIAVPSKAMSAICSGSPVLFCGHLNSDTYQKIKAAAWLVEDNEYLENQVIEWFLKVSKESIFNHRKQALELRTSLLEEVNNAYQLIYETL